ncbi:MAG: cytochrome C oxidase subunit IV family protein [Bacteroidetes bacterium]|nr:cytochrome C oxidase subunit IV family protein [Bacteroidota bacterium]
MKNELKIVLGTLVFLTLITVIIYNSNIAFSLKNNIIFLVSFVKIILIAFFFMDLKNAHLFWKLSLIGLIGFLVLVIIIL